MSNIEIVPKGEGFEVSIDGKIIQAPPGTPMHKMATDLLRLRRLAKVSTTSFFSYTTEQLEAAIADGRGTKDMVREVAKRRGKVVEIANPDRRYTK